VNFFNKVTQLASTHKDIIKTRIFDPQSNTKPRFSNISRVQSQLETSEAHDDNSLVRSGGPDAASREIFSFYN